MAYFKYLPKVYVRNRTIQEGNHPYQLTRNIFRRIKIKDHLLGSLLGFTQYSIGEGERPDQVARKFYGDSGLDWMVLIINNIINILHKLFFYIFHLKITNKIAPYGAFSYCITNYLV